MFAPDERAFLASARVGRLATADGECCPHVVPVCYALVEDRVVTPLDEKPKDASPTDLRRVRNVAENPAVALVVDRYREDWDRLGWVQVRGTGRLWRSTHDDHGAAVIALRKKYDQYADHALEDRPLIAITPGTVRSWGDLRPFADPESEGE